MAGSGMYPAYPSGMYSPADRGPAYASMPDRPVEWYSYPSMQPPAAFSMPPVSYRGAVPPSYMGPAGPAPSMQAGPHFSYSTPHGAPPAAHEQTASSAAAPAMGPGPAAAPRRGDAMSDFHQPVIETKEAKEAVIQEIHNLDAKLSKLIPTVEKLRQQRYQENEDLIKRIEELEACYLQEKDMLAKEGDTAVDRRGRPKFSGSATDNAQSPTASASDAPRGLPPTASPMGSPVSPQVMPGPGPMGPPMGPPMSRPMGPPMGPPFGPPMMSYSMPPQPPSGMPMGPLGTIAPSMPPMSRSMPPMSMSMGGPPPPPSMGPSAYY
eukprot:gnl/TRDRNA2_/TRDRNA2_92471_c0_seq1.p1 gnl/TRDRNA2_/TRDRNA2_92471_c0~~gnl/TRDRNA2_/TRDRNA2_92471_c0_seq1.p1  ORF type:complete len:322 (+),score=41.76 gnl/TRDRNA2_/TRDRNA2_92471_c0_seq1:106-1071(+)